MTGMSATIWLEKWASKQMQDDASPERPAKRLSLVENASNVESSPGCVFDSPEIELEEPPKHEKVYFSRPFNAIGTGGETPPVADFLWRGESGP